MSTHPPRGNDGLPDADLAWETELCAGCGERRAYCLCPGDFNGSSTWPPYGNGDRMEDVEAGISNDSEAAFHTGDGS